MVSCPTRTKKSWAESNPYLPSTRPQGLQENSAKSRVVLFDVELETTVVSTIEEVCLVISSSSGVSVVSFSIYSAALENTMSFHSSSSWLSGFSCSGFHRRHLPRKFHSHISNMY